MSRSCPTRPASLTPTAPVTLTINDENDTFVAIVSDTAGAEGANGDGGGDQGGDPFQVMHENTSPDSGADDLLDVLPSGFGLAVIAGLVDDLDVVGAPNGTVVRMTWKTPRPEDGA